jgi:putative hemolysin
MIRKIDIDDVFKSKNPSLYKILPSFIFSWIKKIVHQGQLNAFLEAHGNKFDFDFIKAVIGEFGLNEKVIGLENLPASGGVVIAANHPLGALDFMSLMDAVGTKRKDVKVFVNDILLNIDNLKNLFAGVNVVGKTAVHALEEIEHVYAQNIAVFTFPAGLVSRKQFPNGFFGKSVIKDLDWKKSFISRAKKYKKNILPVYIEGKNSDFFYNFSLWRKRLGIKANIEMLFLVNEMYKQRGKTITCIFGEEIPYQTFDKRFTDVEWAAKVKEHVYEMGKQMKSLPFQVKSEK